MKFGLVRRGFSPTGGAEQYLLRFADALREAGHSAILFGSTVWPGWQGEFERIRGDGPARFADSLRDATPRDRCELVFSLERVWECDVYRAGDGVHQAWLDRRRTFEPAWKGWFRGTQGKHREMLDLERAVFDPAASLLIIANSQMVAGEIARYYGTPAGRVRVVYNGLPPREAGVGRAEMREQLGLKEGQCAVLFAGSGWQRKGLRFAIEGINRAGQGALLVAGAGSRAGLPASGRTQFLGEVREMRDLMEAADVFLLPTIYDPFSNASLEAMAAGLPVITTEANGFSEVMRPGRDGEVLRTPEDIDGIAAAIGKWAARPEGREERRNEARQYSMERNVRETLDAIGNFQNGSQ